MIRAVLLPLFAVIILAGCKLGGDDDFDNNTFRAPSDIQAEGISQTSIKITWNTVPGGVSYKVYRSPTNHGQYISQGETERNEYTDEGLPSNTSYCYKVSAVDAAGVESPLSNYRKASTWDRDNNPVVIPDSEQDPGSDNGDTSLPAPGSVQAAALSSNSIQITWAAVSGASGYNVYRSLSANGSFTPLAASPVKNSPFTDSGLAANTTYFYRISALKDGKEGALSGYKSATTWNETIPETQVPVPSGVNAELQGENSARVSWNAVEGAESYNVYRSNSSSGSYGLRGASSGTSYTEGGLTAGTAWFYKVSAVKGGRESAQSNFASVIIGGTIQNPPVMPTGLVVSSASPGTISLSWNSVSTADSYNIYRSNTKDGAAGKITTITGTGYTDNIPAGASYYYKVAGANSSGESPRSAAAFAFAVSHYALSLYSGAQTYALGANSKHYYRLPVTAGSSYTIEWQNGSNQNLGRWDSSVRVSAWQNDGTAIFSGAYDGYTSPQVITASASGFVTIEVRNESASTAYNYQIYHY